MSLNNRANLVPTVSIHMKIRKNRACRDTVLQPSIPSVLCVSDRSSYVDRSRALYRSCLKVGNNDQSREHDTSGVVSTGTHSPLRRFHFHFDTVILLIFPVLFVCILQFPPTTLPLPLTNVLKLVFFFGHARFTDRRRSRTGSGPIAFALRTSV